MKLHHILLFLVIFLISACTIPAKIKLYNNSGEMITARVDNEYLIIKSAEVATFGQDYGVEFSIEKDNELFKYQLHRLALSNIEFVGWGPFTKRVFRAQFEANGTVWAVGPEQEYPVTGYIDQPEEFPLVPKKV